MQRTITLLLGICFFVFFSLSSSAAIIRVNASAAGGGNGTTWPLAYNNLQTALSTAVSGDQIWVAAGVYVPGSFSTTSFTITSGVSVYGGFAGVSETLLSERNITTNVTSLSGNGVCNHVVTFNNVSAATLLDGFTIAGASGGQFVTGGGIYNIGGGTNVTVQNCIIRNNSVYQGGGMYNLGIPNASNPTVRNCSFLNNTGSYQGGGVMNYAPEGTAGGTYADCIFDGNGGGQGKGFFNAVEKGASTLSFTNCVFKNHSGGYAFDSYGRGAATSAATSATATTSISFSVCSFSANSGGAVFNNTYNNPNNNTIALTSCTVTESGFSAVNLYSDGGKCTAAFTTCDFLKNGGNTVFMHGGNSGQCNGTFGLCRFVENTGTALYSYGDYSGQSNQTLTNCIFSKNSGGAAMYNLGHSYGSGGQATASVTSCTFVENTSGAVYNYRNFKSTARPSFDNCLFQRNSGGSGGAAVYNNGAGDYCPSFTNCQFLDNTSSGAGGAIYNFFQHSAGDKANTLFASCTFRGNSTGSQAGALYNNFSNQGPVSMTITNSTVSSNTATNAYSEGGGMLNYAYTGVSGTLTIANTAFDDNWAGQGGGGVMNNGRGVNIIYTTCTFNRNKLTNASASLGGGGIYNFGGYNSTGSVIYTDCQINNNTATAYGGGVVNNNSSSSGGGTYEVRYVRCTLNNNKTAGTYASNNYGGGMTNFGMGNYPILTDCSISSNTANTQANGYAEGGGVYNNNSFPTFTNCTINSNTGQNGGGIHNVSASSSTQSTSLINCIVSGNSAIGTGNNGDGGGIYNLNSKLVLVNCQLTGNKATDEGGGMLQGYFSGANNTATLLNSTVSGNSAFLGGGVFYNTSPLILTNSLIWGNSTGLEGFHEVFTFTHSTIESLTVAPGSGNLDGTLPASNPQFVSMPAFSSAPTTAGNFQLATCSPAINAGNPSSAGLPATDLATNTRVFDGRVDMGAFESQTIRTALAITQQPANVSVCQNTNVTIPVTVNGAATAYQFYVNGTLTGSPQGSPTLSNVQPAQAGNYSVVVTGGCNSVISNAFTVTVNSSPQPSVVTMPFNGTLRVQVNGGLSYERLKATEFVNGFLIRITELSNTGYFVIDKPGPYTITVLGGNGCRTDVNGTL
jgi:hypothetical protein